MTNNKFIASYNSITDPVDKLNYWFNENLTYDTIIHQDHCPDKNIASTTDENNNDLEGATGTDKMPLTYILSVERFTLWDYPWAEDYTLFLKEVLNEFYIPKVEAVGISTIEYRLKTWQEFFVSYNDINNISIEIPSSDIPYDIYITFLYRSDHRSRYSEYINFLLNTNKITIPTFGSYELMNWYGVSFLNNSNYRDTTYFSITSNIHKIVFGKHFLKFTTSKYKKNIKFRDFFTVYINAIFSDKGTVPPNGYESQLDQFKSIIAPYSFVVSCADNSIREEIENQIPNFLLYKNRNDKDQSISLFSKKLEDNPFVIKYKNKCTDQHGTIDLWKAPIRGDTLTYSVSLGPDGPHYYGKTRGLSLEEIDPRKGKISFINGLVEGPIDQAREYTYPFISPYTNIMTWETIPGSNISSIFPPTARNGEYKDISWYIDNLSIENEGEYILHHNKVNGTVVIPASPLAPILSDTQIKKITFSKSGIFSDKSLNQILTMVFMRAATQSFMRNTRFYYYEDEFGNPTSGNEGGYGFINGINSYHYKNAPRIPHDWDPNMELDPPPPWWNWYYIEKTRSQLLNDDKYNKGLISVEVYNREKFRINKEERMSFYISPRPLYYRKVPYKLNEHYDKSKEAETFSTVYNIKESLGPITNVSPSPVITDQGDFPLPPHDTFFAGGIPAWNNYAGRIGKQGYTVGQNIDAWGALKSNQMHSTTIHFNNIKTIDIWNIKRTIEIVIEDSELVTEKFKEPVNLLEQTLNINGYTDEFMDYYNDRLLYGFATLRGDKIGSDYIRKYYYLIGVDNLGWELEIQETHACLGANEFFYCRHQRSQAYYKLFMTIGKKIEKILNEMGLFFDSKGDYIQN